MASAKNSTPPADEGIVVAIRIKPLTPAEGGPVWRPVANQAGCLQLTATDGVPQPGATVFRYNTVFGPESTTRDFFDGVVQCVVDGVVEGVNGTIFAYGQTSSGKVRPSLPCARRVNTTLGLTTDGLY